MSKSAKKGTKKGRPAKKLAKKATGKAVRKAAKKKAKGKAKASKADRKFAEEQKRIKAKIQAKVDSAKARHDGVGPYAPERFDARRAAAVALGKQAAGFAAHLAKAPFDEFKQGMRDIGFPAIPSDRPGGIMPVASHPQGLPRLANAVLCMRYPFLVPRSRWTGKVNWYGEMDDALVNDAKHPVGGRRPAFGTTELDAMPIGWIARFGLELCEDLKAVLLASEEHDPLGRYRIDQVKEKYGTLRWYSGGAPEDVWDEELKLIALYERISARTCIACGSEVRVRRTNGWIAYECFDCRGGLNRKHPDDEMLARYNDLLASGQLADLIRLQSDEWKLAMGYDEDRIADLSPAEQSWDVPYAIREIVVKDILDDTSWPVGSIADSPALTTTTWGAEANKLETTEIDLLAWARARGLLVADLARSIDRMRHAMDGDTNTPLASGEDLS